MMLYAYPRFSRHDLGIFRFGGSGLGNLLFPWARSEIAARNNKMALIAPTWPSLKIGPLLRRERDRRTYTGLFQATPDSLTGIRKCLKLLTLQRVSEESLRDVIAMVPQHDALVEFEGLRSYFGDILGEQDYLRERLFLITRPKYVDCSEYILGCSICVHIRLGDFKIGHQMTALHWFARGIHAIRHALNNDVAVFIFSDGSETELAPLLDLGNVRILRLGSSIADLIALSNGGVMIGSAGSTFSLWASYLGQMPTLLPPGNWLNMTYPHSNAHILQWDGQEVLPSYFTSNCLRSLK